MNFVHICFLKGQAYVKQYVDGVKHSRMFCTLRVTFCVWHGVFGVHHAFRFGLSVAFWDILVHDHTIVMYGTSLWTVSAYRPHQVL